MEQAWRREGRATPACGAGVRIAERVRLEEEKPAQRPRFLAGRELEADKNVQCR